MARRPGRSEESCYACKFLASEIQGVTPSPFIDIEFENSARSPVCMKERIDFVGELSLDDSRGMHDKVRELRDGSFVQIKNMFFRIIPADDSIPRPSTIDTDPEEALKLCRRYGIDDMTDDQEDCPGAVRCELLLNGIPSEVLDQQTITASQYEELGDNLRDWEKIIPADSTWRYLPVGTQWTAIVEPFLSNNGCSEGINRITGQPFTSFFMDFRIDRLAKELWGNDVVHHAIETKEPLAVCDHCGFPMPKARREIEIPITTAETYAHHLGMGEIETRFKIMHVPITYCVWCSEEVGTTGGQASMCLAHAEGIMTEGGSSSRSVRQLYADRAKQLLRGNTNPNIVHFPVSLTPRSLAKRLEIKLYAFFVKTEGVGVWNPAHHEEI